MTIIKKKQVRTGRTRNELLFDIHTYTHGLCVSCSMRKVVRHPQARVEDEMHVVEELWRLLRVPA